MLSAGILRSKPFRWGVFLALPPALLGLPAVSYAGIAVVNMVWHLLFGQDSPRAVYYLGGLVYGLSFGVLLQCLLFGIAGHLIWQVGSQHLTPFLDSTSRLTKVVLVAGLEIIIVPVSFYMTMIGYGGPAFLSWLFPEVK